jgi:hypothetical protein
MFNNYCSFIYSFSSASLVLMCVLFSHGNKERSPPPHVCIRCLLSFSLMGPQLWEQILPLYVPSNSCRRGNVSCLNLKLSSERTYLKYECVCFCNEGFPLCIIRKRFCWWVNWTKIHCKHVWKCHMKLLYY